MPSLRTPLCDVLGIHHPIIQAPMAGGWTTAALVAGVSEAGGLGMLAATRLNRDRLEGLIRVARESTRRPFGVNFLLAPPATEPGDVKAMRERLNRIRRHLGLTPFVSDAAPELPPSVLEAQLELVLELRVPIVSFAMGDPGPLVPRLKSAGVTVLASASTVMEAKALESSGVDAIVAQGAEAGGHRTTFDADAKSEPPLVGGLALVPQVVDAVRVPVVAAGGIVDGRGLVAVLALGAQGAQLGTRFLLARESGAPAGYRARLLAAVETDTTVTAHFTGRPARALRNALLAALESAGVPPLAWPWQAAAADDIYGEALDHDLAEWFPLYAGQGLRPLRDGMTAGEIVQEIARDAAGVVASLAGLAR